MSYSLEKILSCLPNGYSLISYPTDISINKNTSIHLKCPEGHDWKTARIGNIEAGARCFLCATKKKGLARVTDVEEFKSRLLLMGYELLSEFKGYAYKVDIRCVVCNHVRTSISYNIAEGCKNCNDIVRKNKALLKLENRLKETGYALLNEVDETKKVSEFRLHLCCNNGHEYWTGYKCFVGKEANCRSCLQLARLDLSQIRLRLDDGYKVEGTYINETSPLTFTCPKGTAYVSNWNKYQRGFRCYCCPTRKDWSLLKVTFENEINSP